MCSRYRVWHGRSGWRTVCPPLKCLGSIKVLVAFVLGRKQSHIRGPREREACADVHGQDTMLSFVPHGGVRFHGCNEVNGPPFPNRCCPRHTFHHACDPIFLPIAVGEESALHILGHLHCLNFGDTGTIHLYSPRSLPSWVRQGWAFPSRQQCPSVVGRASCRTGRMGDAGSGLTQPRTPPRLAPYRVGDLVMASGDFHTRTRGH